MKRFFYLLFTITALSFSSCSSDDDSSNPDNNGGISADILGKWMITEMAVEANMNVEGIVIEMTGVAPNNDPENYTIFRADNTIEVNPLPMTMTMTIKIMGETTTDTQVVNVVLPQAGTWMQEGETLTIQEDGGDPQDFRILTLSNSTLVLTTDNLYDTFPMEDGFEPGPEDTFKMTFSFSRL